VELLAPDVDGLQLLVCDLDFAGVSLGVEASVDLDPYMEATLWPRGALGVLSHETALELYELSDVHPAKIHITLPRSHRVRRGVPSAYTLHHEDLDQADQITQHEGIAIVTPVHAIRQAHKAHLGTALVGQAIDQGEDGGRLTKRQASALRRELGIRRGNGRRG
jgi:hypothetical protein